MTRLATVTFVATGLIPASLAAQGDMQEHDHVATYRTLATEVVELLVAGQPDACTAHRYAHSVASVLLLLTRRHEELADRRAVASDLVEVMSSRIRDTCRVEYWPPPRGRGVAGGAVTVELPGGGKITGRVVEVPALSLATLYMTDAAREQFIRELPDDVAEMLVEWRRQNPAEHELLHSALRSEVVLPEYRAWMQIGGLEPGEARDIIEGLSGYQGIGSIPGIPGGIIRRDPIR